MHQEGRNAMLSRLAVSIVIAATASAATAQMAMQHRPSLGAVFVKDSTDCFDMIDENGGPMCVIGSNAGNWSNDVAYRPVTSMRLPQGRYLITGKVLHYQMARYLNPWVSVECVLEDQDKAVIDVTTSNPFGGHAQYSYSGDWLMVELALNGSSPMVMNGVLDVTDRSGATVSLSCRVQGQANGRNPDGSTYWPAPISDVRFHTAKIVAISVASITKQ